MYKRKMPLELKKCFLIIAGLILAIVLILLLVDNSVYSGLFIALFLALGLSLIARFGSDWKKAYCEWRGINRRKTKKSAFDFDTSIEIPDKEAINGAFVCPACAATTLVKNEVNPSAVCRFCGAKLPDLQDIIDMRDNRYRTAYNQEIEYKMRLKELQQKRDARLEELAIQKEIDEARIRNEEKQERARFERAERAKKNEHRREMQRIENTISAVIGVIILIVILIKILAH